MSQINEARASGLGLSLCNPLQQCAQDSHKNLRWSTFLTVANGYEPLPYSIVSEFL